MEENVIGKVKALNLSDGVHEKVEVDGKVANVTKIGGTLVVATSDSIVSIVSDSVILN